MQKPLPDIRTASELLEHMQKSQAAYLANGTIERRRVRLRGVPGWYWLVVHLAYADVGRRALTVPSQNSVQEKIDRPPTGGIRMVRFVIPSTENLQQHISGVSRDMASKKDKTKTISKQIRSASGYTVGGAAASIAFEYPGGRVAGYVVYGIFVDGKATFVLSTIELDAASATPEEAGGLFAKLKEGIANVQSARVFDQEPDDSKQQIRDYLRSAQPLPTDLNRNHA